MTSQPGRHAPTEGQLCIPSNLFHSLTIQSLERSTCFQSIVNDPRFSPTSTSSSLLPTKTNTQTSTYYDPQFNSNLTPTQTSTRESINSTPKVRSQNVTSDRLAGRQDETAGWSAGARYEQALRLNEETAGPFSSSVRRNLESGMEWRSVWAQVRNAEIMIWSDRSSCYSNPGAPLAVIALSAFDHLQTSHSTSNGLWELTLTSNTANSPRLNSSRQLPPTSQGRTISGSSHSPSVEQEAGQSFNWPRSMSKGGLAKSSSSRALADALRFGSSSNKAETESPSSQRELSHSQSQSTLSGDVKEGTKEKPTSAWSKFSQRSRRLRAFVSGSASSDSISDQASIAGSNASSWRQEKDSMDSSLRDRGTSISSSPLARSIALPSPGISSSSHSTAATSISISPTIPSFQRGAYPAKISLQVPSTVLVAQWVDAISQGINPTSRTPVRSDRCQTSPTGSSGRSRPSLSAIPGFSPPSRTEQRQQPISPTLLPQQQEVAIRRFTTTNPSFQSKSTLMMQATSESKLSLRRKERNGTPKEQESPQAQIVWNHPFSNEGTIQQSKLPRPPQKQGSIGPSPSLKSSSSRTGLAALLMGGGKKRVRDDAKGSVQSVPFVVPALKDSAAYHPRVQTCRASIELSTAGPARGSAEFCRPSTSSGASLKSFGSATEGVQEGRRGKTRSRPSSAAGYEHVQARTSLILSSGLTHAQNLAKQYLAGSKEPPASPVLSATSCSENFNPDNSATSEAHSEYSSRDSPFLKALANRRASSPLAREAMLPEVSSLNGLRAPSPSMKSSSPLSHQSVFTSNSIAQSCYSPNEGGENALDRFARLRQGSSESSSQSGPTFGLGLEGVDQSSSNGHGDSSSRKYQRSWSRSPSFPAPTELSSSGWAVPQSKPRQRVLQRLKTTHSIGSMDSNREEELEDSRSFRELDERRSSLTGSSLGISLALPSRGESRSDSPSSIPNPLGLSRSPSLRNLAHKLLLRPNSASGISSIHHFSSSRAPLSEFRSSRDSESSMDGGRVSSGDASMGGRSLEFDNDVDIDDYEMVPSPRVIPPSSSLPVINLPSERDHASFGDQEGPATPVILTASLAGSGNEKASLGKRTRRTAGKLVNRLGSSPRLNATTPKSFSSFNNDESSTSNVFSEENQNRKQSSSSSSTSSPPVVERILPPEQMITVLDNLRDNGASSPDSRAAAAAHEAMFKLSIKEDDRSSIPQRRSPKPASRNVHGRSPRPRTGPCSSPSKRVFRDPQRHPPSANSNRRAALGSIQNNISEQSGLSLPPPPRMSKTKSARNLAVTLEQGEEEARSSSSPSARIKKLSRSSSEAAIYVEMSDSTPIRDINSAFPSPMRRRKAIDGSEKENTTSVTRKRSNSNFSIHSFEGRDLMYGYRRASSQEVLLDSDSCYEERESPSSQLFPEEPSNTLTSGNGSNNFKTLTSSNTSNTFVNLNQSNGLNSQSAGDESFGTVTASNSFSSTLEGSQDASIFHVTGKPIISQL